MLIPILILILFSLIYTNEQFRVKLKKLSKNTKSYKDKHNTRINLKKLPLRRHTRAHMLAFPHLYNLKNIIYQERLLKYDVFPI